MYDEQRRAVGRRYPEDALQRSIVEYLDWSLPATAICFAVPNGGKRHRREAARLQGLGVKAGIPDLCVISAGTVLFFEVKAARGTLSFDQRERIQKLEYCGASVYVVRSVEQVETILRQHRVLLRATVAAFANDNLGASAAA